MTVVEAEEEAEEGEGSEGGLEKATMCPIRWDCHNGERAKKKITPNLVFE